MLLNPTEILLAEVNAFLDRSGMAAARLGKDAIGDPNFVRHLRAGREPRFGTAQRVREFIETKSAEYAS